MTSRCRHELIGISATAEGSESVIEALTVGWVDSHKCVIDDDRSMHWFTFKGERAR